MTIKRDDKGFKVTCDFCAVGEVLLRHDDPEEAQTQLDALGWETIEAKGSKAEHRCTACQ